jgi:hypothetical protein
MGMQNLTVSLKNRRSTHVSIVPVLTLRLMPNQIAPLDAWIAAHPEPSPSRPEVIRRILGQALGKLADAGSIPAEDLNAGKARKAK